MSRVLPILFNTDMVRAILDGRKTVTRRVAKKIPAETHRIEPMQSFDGGDLKFECHWGGYMPDVQGFKDGMAVVKPPYQPGDILYVRETWGDYRECQEGGCGYYMYRADYPDGATTYLYHEGTVCDLPRWHPSIHMPKDAARIWIKVTDVRVERLQEITEEQAYMEGTDPWDEACYANNGWHPTLSDPDSGGTPNIIDGFRKLWNSTIKKPDLVRYGWDANPWVWVIGFERCEKPSASP